MEQINEENEEDVKQNKNPAEEGKKNLDEKQKKIYPRLEPEKRVLETIKIISNTLDLSGFQLQDIKFLAGSGDSVSRGSKIGLKEIQHLKENIIYLNISRNSLLSIDILNEFPNLK